MPSMVNGIGTHYWGKANLETRWAVCEHCGRSGDLRSYDTTKYFVVVFLPLIPLGKLRILDDCPQCRRHQTIKLSQWASQRKELVAAALAAYFEQPEDRERAEQALGTCVYYREGEEVLPLVAKIYRCFGQDVEMVTQLAETLDFFDQPQPAESAYKRALGLSDTPGLRESLAGLLIRQGRPGEAQPLLDHLVQSDAPHALGSLLFLVEGFQAQGQHAEALQLLKSLKTNFVQFRDDKAFKKELRKLRKISEKHVQSRKPVISSALATAGKAVDGGADWGGRFALAVWPLLILAFLGPLGWWMKSSAESHGLHLVSGLDRAYQVEIEGLRYTVPAGQAAEIEVPRNQDLTAVVMPGGPDLETMNFRLEATFWQSLWGQKMYVLNPDRVGVLLWAQTRYAENPNPDEELPYEFRVGEGLYSWEGVDYKFEEFPEEIQISSSSSSVVKDGLTLMTNSTPSELFYLLLGEHGEETAIEFLRRRVQFDQEPGDAVILLSTFLPSADFTALAAPYLEERPVAVEWHRAYQNVLEQDDQGERLKVEYEALLRAEPDESRLHYLRSRVELDQAPREALLRRAIELEETNAYAQFGLAYSLLASGQGEEALPLATRAEELQPGKESFRALAKTALLANGKYEELLARVNTLRQAEPLNGQLAAEAVNLLSALGRDDEVDVLITAVVRSLADPVGGAGWGDHEEWNNYLRSVALQARGDVEAFVAHQEGAKWWRGAFQGALMRGDAAAAAAALEAEEDGTAEEHLLVFLAALRAGDGELARREREAATGLLALGNQEAQILAAALAGRPVDVDVTTLTLDPERKVVALIALARIDRRRASSYLRLARQLNYHLGFPRLFLDGELGGRA